MNSLSQHQLEIEKNLQRWKAKPLLQKIYHDFYDKIVAHIDPHLPGKIAELGSGIGNLKSRVPQSISTDLFPNPWVDLVCDGYELPFRNGTISHLILFDVFHHLEVPGAFLKEARRVLGPGGRIILFEPYISGLSFPVYGGLHHEPVAFSHLINVGSTAPRPRNYYAAQGNATRVFFKREAGEILSKWKILYTEAFSAFAYLFSGGYSKPSIYPVSAYGFVARIDKMISPFPKLFAGRCLVVLSPV